MSSDTNVGSVKSTGLAMIGLADCLQSYIQSTLFWQAIEGNIRSIFIELTWNFNTPSWSEVTIGSQDDDFRHAISKLADFICICGYS